MGRRWQAEDEMRSRMLAAGGGTIYPACTCLRLAYHSAPAYRQSKASEVWRIALVELTISTDPEALLYALADGVTLGPHGVPWR